MGPGAAAGHIGAGPQVERLADLDAHYAIGIGPPEARRRLDGIATGSGSEAATLVHPQATIASDVRAAPGLVMAAGSRITTNVTVGRHAIST